MQRKEWIEFMFEAVEDIDSDTPKWVTELPTLRELTKMVIVTQSILASILEQMGEDAKPMKKEERCS